MASILSQNEVDALLGAVESGELALEQEQDRDGLDGSILEYNFRRPNLLTKDHFRLFNTLHSYFARETQAGLFLVLRKYANLLLVATDQQQYSEFILSLSEVTNIMRLGVKGTAGFLLVEMNSSLVFSMVDVLLGGEGDVSAGNRPLTEVEMAIVEPVWDQLIQQLESSLSTVMPIELTKEEFESNPEYVQAAPADAPVIVLTFEVNIGEGSGILNLCYPYSLAHSLLERIQGKAGQIEAHTSGQSVDEASELMVDAVMSLPVQMSAVLGKATIRAESLLGLEVGDVLVSATAIDASTVVYVEETPMFSGRVGRLRRKLAVKVNRVFMPPADEDDQA